MGARVQGRVSLHGTRLWVCVMAKLKGFRHLNPLLYDCRTQLLEQTLSLASIVSIGHISTTHLAGVTLGFMTANVSLLLHSHTNLVTDPSSLFLAGHRPEYTTGIRICSRLATSSGMDFASAPRGALVPAHGRTDAAAANCKHVKPPTHHWLFTKSLSNRLVQPIYAMWFSVEPVLLFLK